MRKSTIAITGANGFVGRAVCAQSVAAGMTTIGITRTPQALEAGIANIAVGAIDENTLWSSALSGVDCVIHLAARVHVMRETSTNPLAEFRRVNVDGTEHLARSAAAIGVKRLVYVSSIKVNGEETVPGSCYTEASTPMPQDPYGQSKWEAELALHRIAEETGLEVVIIRPPLIYGPGVKGNFQQMLSAAARGIPLPLGSIDNRRDLVYVGNLADALIVSVTHPTAVGNTYLICDGEPVSTPELLSRLAVAMGRPSRVFPFPLSLLRIIGRTLGKSPQIQRLLGSLQIDNGKICRELAWRPPYTMQRGLQETTASLPIRSSL